MIDLDNQVLNIGDRVIYLHSIDGDTAAEYLLERGNFGNKLETELKETK